MTQTPLPICPFVPGRVWSLPLVGSPCRRTWPNWTQVPAEARQFTGLRRKAPCSRLSRGRKSQCSSGRQTPDCLLGRGGDVT